MWKGRSIRLACHELLMKFNLNARDIEKQPAVRACCAW